MSHFLPLRIRSNLAGMTGNSMSVITEVLSCSAGFIYESPGGPRRGESRSARRSPLQFLLLRQGLRVTALGPGGHCLPSCGQADSLRSCHIPGTLRPEPGNTCLRLSALEESSQNLILVFQLPHAQHTPRPVPQREWAPHSQCHPSTWARGVSS